MSGSFSGEGEKITLNIDMDTDGNYTLSSYNFNQGKSASIIEEGEKNDLKRIFPELTDNPKIHKKLERCIEIADLMQKVIM